jgi:glutamate racemase
MIGLFDSGVGGLSVLRQVRQLLPSQPLLYLADQAHIPYGGKPTAQITQWSIQVAQFLLEQGARLIIVACNTATAAALDTLRVSFPDVPFVGMEPAVRPAALSTRSGKVGVLATSGTFDSQRYTRLMHMFAQDITILQDPCQGLVELIEDGQQDEPETLQLLRRLLTPMLTSGVDTLVLGCTHYPFVREQVRSIVGDHVTIIDPAPAVARQTERLVKRHAIVPDPAAPRLQSFSTGEVARFRRQLLGLLGYDSPVYQLRWQNNLLTL